MFSRVSAVSRVRHLVGGFTLVELMITLVIVAIGVALAVPSWTAAIEKRRITSAAEEIVSLFNYAQTEAVKRNQMTTLSWDSSGGHNKNWCMGVTLGEVPCDCEETRPAESDFCDVDGTPYRVYQATFTDINDEFLHTNGNLKQASISFDPIRGIPTNMEDAVVTEIGANDYLFYMHTNTGSGGSRNYELQVRMNMVGRVTICTDDDRKSIVGGYDICP